MGLKKILESAPAQHLMATGKQMFNDATIEYFTSDLLTEKCLMAPGKLVQRTVGGKQANANKTENLISNGSFFEVRINQCALLIENGKVHDCIIALDNDTAGKYQYLTDLEPSWITPFTKKDVDGSDMGTKDALFSTLKDTFKTYAERLAAGGQSTNSMYLVYINLRRIANIPVGAKANIFEPHIKMKIKIGVHGTVSLKIEDPVYFYENYVYDPKTPITYENHSVIKEARTKIMNSIQPIMAKLAQAPDVSWGTLDQQQDLVSRIVDEVVGPDLLANYGLRISNATFNTEMDEALAEKLSNLGYMHELGSDSAAMTASLVNAQANLINSQGEAMKLAGQNAGKNGNGSAMDMMAMAMMGNMANNNFQNSMGMVNNMQQQQMMNQQMAYNNGYGQMQGGYPPQYQQMPQQGMGMIPQPQMQNNQPLMNQQPISPQVEQVSPQIAAPTGKGPSTEEEWICPNCGNHSTTRFCMECGSPKPAPKPVENKSWICPNCGTQNESKFCKNCGTKKPESNIWTCPNCGTTNESKFCKNCGTKKP